MSAIPASSSLRSKAILVYPRNMLSPPPPPPNEPPPPPMSPPLMTEVKSPFSRIELSPVPTGLQGPKSPQATRMTPRPRVPRMGTSVSPAQLPTITNAAASVAAAIQGGDGQMDIQRPRRTLESRVSLRSVNFVQPPPETNCLVNFGVQKQNQQTMKPTATAPPSSRSVPSNSRLVSSAVSSDLRKLFGRSGYLPNEKRTQGIVTCNTGRLTPISERTNASSPPSTKQSYFSDYSLSDSELSDVTETTNLSLTWPLSRSQTDLSAKLYRSFSKVRPDESHKEENSLAQPQSVNRQTAQPGVASSIQRLTPPSSLQPSNLDYPIPSTEVAELKHWMAQIDQDEIATRFKRMRVVTMTARRWTIKRRPDGTRYLAYRRSHGNKCCQHSVSSSGEVTRGQPEDPFSTHPAPSEQQETELGNSKPMDESKPSEPAGRRKRHKSHRSNNHCPCLSISSSVPSHRTDRPESFPPSTQTNHVRQYYCPHTKADQHRDLHSRPSVQSEMAATTPATSAVLATVNSRSTHKRSRHRGRRMDGARESARSSTRNASCCLHRADPHPNCEPGERAYLYCLETTRLQDRTRDVSFSSVCPTSQSNRSTTDGECTKLVTMLVV